MRISVNESLSKNYYNKSTINELINNDVIVKSVNIYATQTIQAGEGADIYFAVPTIKNYSCILGIGGSGSNGNIIPVRPSNAPNGDGTLILHYRNISNSPVTVSDLNCNMIFTRDIK